MKLEVGKKYRTREGKVVKITCTTADVEYRFMGDNTFTYTPQGGYYIDTQSTYDLVEEIKTSEVKLEVGKVYSTECGAVAFVKTYDPNPHLYYPFIVKVRGHERGYNEDGFHCSSHVASSLNIIEEIQETKMKLEVGKKYRTMDGTVVTVKSTYPDPVHPFEIDDNGVSRLYTEDGFHHHSKTPYELNIVEEIKESTMFNKDYKYLCMDADGYNKASFNRPTINTDMNCWDDYDLLIQKNFFNLGDDWKDSLREIVYNDDGSIYLRKPKYEFKVDDKVLVRGTGDTEWKKRHFSHWDCNGKPRCFADGTTSFSGVHVNMWDEIKPYEDEGE